MQVLTLMNHPRVLEKVEAKEGLVASVIEKIKEPAARIDELFLASVGRFPDDQERAACQKFVDESESPQSGLSGVLLGLLNTREFLLQH